MGYKEEFPVGTRIRIQSRENLETFIKEWKWHDPLPVDKLQYAGKIFKVESVGFYFGGDVLYKLEGIEGLWHEQNLVAADEK
jgi:hypothetical protein